MDPLDDLRSDDLLQELAANLRLCQDEVESLHVGMKSRHMIGMAQGMLMIKYTLGQEQALDFLKRTSQDENVKLREVARRVVTQLSPGTQPAPTV